MVINNKYITNFVNIANTYINLGFWPLYKNSTSIIISKLNKLVYNSPKTFYPIVLFNTLGKLIKKVISNRLQTYLIASNFIYLNQLGELKYCSILDVGLYLTHLIYTK